MTVQQIISALRQEVTEDGHILLDRLEKELKVYYWPGAVFDAALVLFGPQLHNEKSRTRNTLDSRIRHAMTTWTNRCGGSLNDEQEKYASNVLQAAFQFAQRDWVADGKPRTPTLVAYAATKITDMIDHDRVHEGFKTRSGRRDRTADLTELLGGGAAE